MMKAAHLVAALLLLMPAAGWSAAPVNAENRTLMFDVYLDGRKIGYHRFEIHGPRANAAVLSEASFDVRFLFVTAYSYRHNTREHWNGGCLSEIEATTNANGRNTGVVGTRTEHGFVIETGDGATELPRCVMSFAYWNPRFLEQPRLLNPQTGEYLDVAVEELGDDVVEVGGRAVPARTYRITARQVDIKVWYSEDAEWLGLESVAKGGRIIRYRLS